MAEGKNIPSINGFYIRGEKTMQGEDGMVIRCSLHFRGRKLGNYFDGGYGGDYSFYPADRFSRASIEKALERFPQIPSSFEGLPPISWDIGILVERLIEMKDSLKRFRNARKAKLVLVSIESEKLGLMWTMKAGPAMPDEMLEEKAREAILRKEPRADDMKVSIIRNEEDLVTENTDITIEMLME